MEADVPHEVATPQLEFKDERLGSSIYQSITTQRVSDFETESGEWEFLEDETTEDLENLIKLNKAGFRTCDSQPGSIDSKPSMMMVQECGHSKARHRMALVMQRAYVCGVIPIAWRKPLTKRLTKQGYVVAWCEGGDHTIHWRLPEKAGSVCSGRFPVTVSLVFTKVGNPKLVANTIIDGAAVEEAHDVSDILSAHGDWGIRLSMGDLLVFRAWASTRLCAFTVMAGSFTPGSIFGPIAKVIKKLGLRL